MKRKVMTTDMVSLTSFFSETEMEGISPLSNGEDLFFPAIECAKRLGYPHVVKRDEEKSAPQ